MKLFLFLDDWFIDAKCDVDRVYPPAKLEKVFDWYSPDSDATHFNVTNKLYEAWAGPGPYEEWTTTVPDDMHLVTSEDGENWTGKREAGKVTLIGDPPPGKPLRMTELPDRRDKDRWHGLEFDDRWDPDPDRRYKCIVWPFARHISAIGEIEGGVGLVACSPDGIHWTADMRHQWFGRPNGADTCNNIIYNPIIKKWQVICRPWNLDRRVAMVESEDLEHWTDPRVIVHPEETDGPCMQFYGMPALVYEDEYLFGAVNYYRTPAAEGGEALAFADQGTAKWLGTVDVKLAYSYDGQSWWRPDRRHVLIPRGDPGTYLGGAMYCKTIDVDKDGTINFFSKGYTVNHGVAPDGYPRNVRTLVRHSLRHDGFCYLEATGWGRFSTRPLWLNDGELTLNYNAGGVGCVRVQASDIDRKPIAGYTFDDCIPLEGDEIYGAVRWRDGKNLADFVGKEKIRLDFLFMDARIYAFRIDCGLWYTYTPEPIERI